MTFRSKNLGPSQYRLNLLLRAAAFILAAGFSCVPAFAQTAESPSASAQSLSPNPVDDFKKQSEDVKKNLQSVLTKIDQSAKEIETLSNPETAKKQIEDLQEVIANALGAVADNGAAAQLGEKALKYARDKQRQLESETKFKPDERDLLVREWKRIGDETEQATADLTKERGDFARLLRMVQTRGDFITELQAINNAQRMLDVIRQLANDIKSASEAMKAYVHTVVPSGS
jgi:hypothetical protein